MKFRLIVASIVKADISTNVQIVNGCYHALVSKLANTRINEFMNVRMERELKNHFLQGAQLNKLHYFTISFVLFKGNKLRLSGEPTVECILILPGKSMQIILANNQPRPQSSPASFDVTSPTKLVGRTRLGRLAINGKFKMAEPGPDFGQILLDLKTASDKGWNTFTIVCQQWQTRLGDFAFKERSIDKIDVDFDAQQLVCRTYRYTKQQIGNHIFFTPSKIVHECPEGVYLTQTSDIFPYPHRRKADFRRAISGTFSR